MFSKFPSCSIPAAFGLAVCCLLFHGCSKGTGKQADRAGAAGKGGVPIEARIIRPELLRNTIHATGTLLANEEVELRSEISGRVTGVYFQEGKKVKKGELLLKINDRELKARLKGKEIEEKQASDEETRRRKLFEISAISQEEYDRILNVLRKVQAEKEAIESQLAETEIRAPFDGRPGLRYISEGGFITPALLAATIQEVDPMKVEFSVPEKYAPLLKIGLGILLHVTEEEQGHTGNVFAVESKIDPGTRTIKARAKIPNPGDSLIPGSFAKIEITLQEIPDAILIPSEAVIPEMKGEMVYIASNGKARAVPVKTGIRTDRKIQVVQGLSVNDTLIVSGLLQLSDGKEVSIRTLTGN